MWVARGLAVRQGRRLGRGHGASEVLSGVSRGARLSGRAWSKAVAGAVGPGGSFASYERECLGKHSDTAMESRRHTLLPMRARRYRWARR